MEAAKTVDPGMPNRASLPSIAAPAAVTAAGWERASAVHSAAIDPIQNSAITATIA